MSNNIEWLRRAKLEDKTSTYNKNSNAAVLGAAAEIICCNSITGCIETMGLNFNVARFVDMSANDNAINGDLYIYCKDEFKFSIEVKSSDVYPNATISESEILHSKAKFLMAITVINNKGKLWITTMDQVRRKAKEVETFDGRFWLIAYDKVEKIPIGDIFK